MKHTVYDRLARRELGRDRSRYSSVRGIYGDRQWVQDMDIVNELDGHTGCVNALSWSSSGRLLASGSDDHRINIHSYHPESSTSQFNLTTSILTNHVNNIFSVKFMPYSNDRTIVSATDTVRIFDIEHSGHSALAGSRSQPSTRRPIGTRGMRDRSTLTEGDTNAKAFSCHDDIVKRIVTEDNPFYFLTCSEDGDVRQWDIRQPARAYPKPNSTDNAPPPLISYSRYNLDLNTVSCSPSQPHYIALGGAHLHCFLHDRRMLGRDKYNERGAKLSSPGNWSHHEDAVLGKATQCVKKFAPNGQKRMGRRDNGHITACKISDANPNEIIVSWSGDHIYSFDILRSPDATEEVVNTAAPSEESRRAKGKSRKRKRPKSSTLAQEAGDRAGSRQRTESSDESLALRVSYGNGQSEEIRIQSPESPPTQNDLAILEGTDHYRIAKTTIKILKCMLDASEEPNKPALTSVLGFAASILPEMDEISRAWRYPVDPSPVDVAVQNKLRDDRASSRRFVQAAGTLARIIGGQLRTGGNSDALISQYFASVQPVPNERPLPRHEQFGYDFLKAIFLWLDSGLGALVEGFSGPGSSNNRRLCIPAGSDVDAIDEILIPYLLELASDRAIINVDASRFESDETRVLCSSEKAAVIDFSRALKIPFADLTGAVVPATGDRSSQYTVQDRGEAIHRWAFKIGRGALRNAVKSIMTFTFVDRAFGGRGVADPNILAMEQEITNQQEDVDPLVQEEEVVDAQVVGTSSRHLAPGRTEQEEGSTNVSNPEARLASNPTVAAEAILEEEAGGEDDSNDEDSDGDIDPSDAEDDDDDDDEDDEDDEDEQGLSQIRGGWRWRSDFNRSLLRARVESHIPCAPHTRVYTGHCNVRTVKDVNFYGLQDEYVVSGSDDGNFFIWDRKTGELLNILEGDGEVVNVVQGHPYEPTMAISGIDHTIKIFSPDAQAHRNARKGFGVQSCNTNTRNNSWGISGPSPSERQDEHDAQSDVPATYDSSFSDDEEEVANNGLSSRKRMHQQYRITSHNDMERKDGTRDACITRAFLAQLAQRMHAARYEEEDGEDSTGATVVANEENCIPM